jgi:hypothetical protein
MSRQDRLQTAAQRYIDREQFSGIEWRVEAGGLALTRGQVGVADACPVRIVIFQIETTV